MNKHIELVEKWLEDNNSVSLKELRDNDYAAAYAADANANANADAAASAACAAAYAADANAYNDAAAYYVKQYKELTK